MKKRSIKKIQKVIDNIPSEQIENMQGIVSDYIFEQQKKRIIEKIDPRDYEVIENIMPALTYVSELDIRKAESSPDFKLVYKLLKESKNESKLNEDLYKIYKRNRSHALNYLYINRGKTLRNILGNQLDNFQALKRRDKEKSKIVLDKCISKADHEDINKLNIIDKLIIKHENFIFMLKLRESLLITDCNPGDYLQSAALLIANPKHQYLELMYLDAHWNSFPLKWYIHNQPVSYGRNVFEVYKSGGDLSNFFSVRYSGGEFDDIEKLLDSHYLVPPVSHALCCRKSVIQEVISCYRKKLFSASICTSLTIIEGMLWDFSREYHAIHGGIYSDSNFEKIKLESNKESEKFTIGVLLKSTKFKEALNIEFITYFCDELYNERNPILHGKEVRHFNSANASKKIATIEYLLNCIEQFHKDRIMEGLDKNIDNDFKDKVLDQVDNKFV
ncbi:hypothetical protein ACPV3S_06020 [Photobacterium damselae]|uniref:hypothetical protein n=1 Tax=Photobacterium damselae TaxID=38293 RepID=UPI0040679716